MQPIKTNQKTAQSDLKSAQLTHSFSPPQDTEKKDKSLPKTHLNYWKGKDKLKHTAAKDGTISQTFSVQIQHQRKRVRFPLKLTSKEAAARKAHEIYLYLLANGWKETLTKYKPEATPTLKSPTVGEYLDAARSVMNVRERTFNTSYASKFRTLVARITGKEGDKRKNDYVGVLDNETGKRGIPGAVLWRKEIDSVKLSAITPEAVTRWKVTYIREHGKTPETRRSATNTVITILRNSASLFAPKVVRHLNDLHLPNPLPFDGVEIPTAEPARYISRFNRAELYQKALAELWNTNPKDKKREEFTILLLALFMGLRAGEIDALKWENIDFEEKILHIEPTDVGDVKSVHSKGTLKISEGVLAVLREKKSYSKSQFVIEASTALVVPSSSNTYRYRCSCHLKKLSAWLRANGLKGIQKPIHTQRKEFGSYINEKHGIGAAADLLRHCNIQLTRRYYVAPNTTASFDPSDLVTKSATKIKDVPKQ